jgi:hypothetical protein
LVGTSIEEYVLEKPVTGGVLLLAVTKGAITR